MKSVLCYKKRQFQFLGSLHMYMNGALMYVAKPQMIKNIIYNKYETLNINRERVSTYNKVNGVKC